MQAKFSLACSETVAAGKEFTVRVELSETKQLESQKRDMLNGVPLTVQLVAPGFTLAPGEHWRTEVVIRIHSDLDRTVLAEYHPTADPTFEGAAAEVRWVQTVLSTGGQVLGALEQVLAVAVDQNLLNRHKSTPPDEAPAGLQGLFRFLVRAFRDLWSFLLGEGRLPQHSHLSPEDQVFLTVMKSVGEQRLRGASAGTVGIPRNDQLNSTDLTLWIRRGDPRAPCRLFFTIVTRYKKHLVRIPDQVPSRDLSNDDARKSVRPIIDMVGKYSEEKYSKEGLRTASFEGIGTMIAEYIPKEVWNALRDVGSLTKGQPPTLLIYTEDPFIPWELAVMPDPIFPTKRPYLGAQAVVGRWVIGQDERGDADAKLGSIPQGGAAPVLALSVKADASAVITPKYPEKKGTFPQLEHAEEEAKWLIASLKSMDVKVTVVKATTPGDVMGYFRNGSSCVSGGYSKCMRGGL